MGPIALAVGRVDPVIADQRIRHGDDLAAIGRIGQDFLITGHGGVEAGLPGCGDGRSEPGSLKHPAIFQGEKRATHRTAMFGAVPGSFKRFLVGTCGDPAWA